MGTPSRFKERVKQERQQEILDAARDVFAERGFEGASIDDIAERVGIGKGTVYLHFASKEELLVGLMQRGCEHLMERCQRLMAPQATPLDKLRNVLACVIDYRFANERWMSVVASEMPHFMGHRRKEGAVAGLRNMVAGLIEQGQREGQIDGRIRPAQGAIMLFFLVFSELAITGRPRMTKAELIDSAAQIYFHGISKEVAV